MATDIDVDVADRDKALVGLPAIAAALVNKAGARQRHPSGVYFQRVPIDPFDGCCSLTYSEAEQFGYFKIDLLNNSIYQKVRDEAHLIALMQTEPAWELLEEPAIVQQLVHIHSHFDVVNVIRPRSIYDLAVCIALIRPGKRHLLHEDRSVIDAELWKPPKGGYAFKKSHAVSYSMTIAIQLNLLIEQAEFELDSQHQEMR